MGELVWRPLAQGSVRTTLIVFPSPCFDELFGLGHRREPSVVGSSKRVIRGAFTRIQSGPEPFLIRDETQGGVELPFILKQRLRSVQNRGA